MSFVYSEHDHPLTSLVGPPRGQSTLRLEDPPQVHWAHSVTSFAEMFCHGDLTRWTYPA